MKPQVIVLIVITGMILSLTGALDPAMAHWEANGNPVAASAANERNSHLVSDGARGAVFVWYGGAWNTYAQRLDSNGSPLWLLNGVNVTPFSGDHYNPQLASDGGGGAIIAWQDSRSGNWTIYAQRMRANGTAAWATTGVAVCVTTGNHISQQIIPDGAGGAIIAWQDGRNGAYDVYAQRLDGNGTPLWTTNGVAVCTAAGVQDYISLVSDGAGGAILTWQDARDPYYDVYAQRISAGGAPLWTANGVAVCTAARYQGTPKAVADGASGAVITWTDDRSGSWDIYARRVNAAGAPLWTANGVAICTAYSSQTLPQIATDGAGGAIMTWQDERAVGQPDIYVRRVSADGAPMWTADGVALCTASYSQGGPLIVSDGAGGAIVTWIDWRNVSSMDVYAGRISGGGTPLWQPNGVPLCTNTVTQTLMDIASDGAGGAIAVWDDFRNTPFWDVYAGHVNAWGSMEPIATAFASAYAEIENGCVTLSWQVTEDASASSFAVRRSESSKENEFVTVDAAISEPSRRSFSSTDCSAQAGKTYWYEIVYAGESGEAACEPMKVSIAAPAPGAYALYQNHPNPFNPSCMITYEIPRAGRVTLSVFDARGSLVATLVDGWRGEGVHSETWNGTSADGAPLPSGVYFYCVKAGKFEATRKMVLLK